MQKAPVMKGSGLQPLDTSKSSEEVHVFGRNLEDRVVTNDEVESPSISFNNIPSSQNTDDDDIESIRKRKFDAITGEEDEETIFQGDFKLFVWDLPTSNWIEKGRGQMKLNDSIDQDEKRSRLIMRVSGTLRIILNVAINRSFFKVIANSKTNIRFTDSQTVWAASGSNAHVLKDFIDERLKITAEEEENELRKRAKSVTDETAPSKKTKADSDNSEPSPSKANEDESTQKGSNEKDEVDDGTESDSQDGSSHQLDNAGDRDANEESDELGRNEQKEEEDIHEGSANQTKIKSSGEDKSSDEEGEKR